MNSIAVFELIATIIGVPSTLWTLWTVYATIRNEISKRHRIDISRLPKLVHRLCELIDQENFKPTTIIGVSRGGMILAGHISEHYKTPIQIAVYERTESYSAKGKRTIEVKDPYKVDVTGKQVLIVCAEFISGDTLEKARVIANNNGAAEVQTLSLYTLNHTEQPPDFSVPELVFSTPPILPWKETASGDKNALPPRQGQSR